MPHLLLHLLAPQTNKPIPPANRTPTYPVGLLHILDMQHPLLALVVRYQKDPIICDDYIRVYAQDGLRFLLQPGDLIWYFFVVGWSSAVSIDRQRILIGGNEFSGRLGGGLIQLSWPSSSDVETR